MFFFLILEYCASDVAIDFSDLLFFNELIQVTYISFFSQLFILPPYFKKLNICYKIAQNLFLTNIINLIK